MLIKNKKIDKVYFLKSIISATNELLINDHYYNAVSTALGIIGDAARLNRIYLFRNKNISSDSPTTEKIFTWNAEDQEVEVNEAENKLNEVRFRDIPELIEPLKRRESFIYTVSELKYCRVKELLRHNGTLTVIAHPIFVHDEFWGFIGYDECDYERRWSKEELSLIEMFTNSISKAIERNIKEEERRYLSFHDSLTGLYNRRYIENEMKKMELNIEQELPLSIIVADVNGLKLVNDSFGHLTGDRIIKASSSILDEGCLPQYTVARWGGDEFLVLLPKTDSTQVKQLVEELNQTCERKALDSIPVSISIGHATSTCLDEPLYKTLKRAEDNMYKEKLVKSSAIKQKLIKTILNTFFEKYPEEKEHAIQVSELSVKIGKVMHLSESDLRKLEKSSIYHDIGKIALDQSILTKEYHKLSTEDVKERKRHAEIGYRILRSSTELSELATYILLHHERLDGSGYPNGVKEDEIPLITKILTVANNYDAMRRYKQLTEKEAIKRLIIGSGVRFDSLIVRTFVEGVLGHAWYSVISGAYNTVIENGQSFDPLTNIMVYDSTDPSLTLEDIRIDGTVHTNVSGTYKLIYTLTNCHGETERIERRISVGGLIPLLNQNDLSSDLIMNDGASFEVVKREDEIMINVMNGGHDYWSSQLSFKDITLIQNRTYVISFEAVALIPRDLIVSVGNLDVSTFYWNSFLVGVNNRFHITNKKEQYTLMFTLLQETCFEGEVKFEFGRGLENQITISNFKVNEYVK